MENAEREQVARTIYEESSPEERRERFAFNAAYRSAYNRVLDSEDRVTLPRYLTRKWGPILGGDVAWLYVVLRDMAQVEARNADSWCWPEQNDLARRVRMSKNTLRRCLGVLEAHGFIRRERRRERPASGWGMVQGTNRYEVFLDVPLTPEDSVLLLLEEMAVGTNSPEFNLRTQGQEPVAKALSSGFALSAPEVTNSTQGSEQVRGLVAPEFKFCALNVNNVTNVDNVLKVSLKDDPRVRGLGSDERRTRDALAHEIGETIARLSGEALRGPHRSLGLHRRIAFLMPRALVAEAIRATRDAAENQRAGRKTLRGGLSEYFAGIAFALADREGIDLGVKRRRSARKPPQGPRTHGTMGPGVHAPEQASPATQGLAQREVGIRSESELSDDERARVKAMIQRLIGSWPHKADPAVAK